MGGSGLDIIHISDFHFTGSSVFDVYAFNRGLEEINSMKADLVVSTGDLTDRGLRGEYQLARSFFSQVRHPVFHIIGNHDARNVGHGLFEEYFGPRRVRHEGENYVLFGYDSTIPDMNEGRFGELLSRELCQDLESVALGKLKIVAFHHHLLPIPMTGRERGVLLDGGTVLKHILDNEVDIVLNGHKHMTTVTRIENTVISNAGTFSCEKLRAGGNHTFNTLRVHPDGKIVVRVHEIEGDAVTEFVRPKMPRPPQPKGECCLRIVHVSDTHFTHGEEFQPEVYKRAVDQINEVGPDVFIHAGDITHQGLPEEVEVAIDHLRDIDSPTRLFTLGIHDMRHIGPETFRKRYDDLIKISPEGRLLFGEEYRNLINVFDSDDVAIAFINSSMYDSTKGLIGRRKLAMARETLAGVDGKKPRIVAFHHHIIPLPGTKEAELLEDGGNVLAGLVESRVDMILTGHRHRSFCTQVEDTIILNSNTLSSRRPVQECRNSFNIIEVTTDGMAVIRERCITSGEDELKGVYRLPYSTGGPKDL